MGWTFTHRPRGESTLEFFRREIDCENKNGSWKVLACSSTFTAAYLAVERKPAGEDPFVFALACPIRYSRDPYCNFGYKDVCESMGPVDAECPKHILEMLSETDNEYALEWRRKCWQKIDQRGQRPKLRAGVLIEMSDSVEFAIGTYSRFYVERGFPQPIFRVGGGHGHRVRIRRPTLKRLTWKVVEPEEEKPRTQRPEANTQLGLF